MRRLLMMVAMLLMASARSPSWAAAAVRHGDRRAGGVLPGVTVTIRGRIDAAPP